MNTLDRYFDSAEKTMLRIPKKKSTEYFYAEFTKRIDVELQKLGANAYTRTVRMVLPKVYLGYSSSSIDNNIPVYGIYVGDHIHFGGLVIDIIRCSPDTNRDILKLIVENSNYSKEINQLKQKVTTETIIDKINALEEKIQKNSKMIAELIDYNRVIDSIFFNFIRYIVAEIDRGSSTKMFEYAIELFKKIILDNFGKILNIEDMRLFNAMIDYIFTVSYTNISPKTALLNVGRRYGKEVYDLFIQKGIHKLTSLNDITTAMGLLKFANITPTAFNSILARRLDTESVAILHSSYDYYIGWATLTLHSSYLFDIEPIDKTIQSNIETIVLNYKSKVRI